MEVLDKDGKVLTKLNKQMERNIEICGLLFVVTPELFLIITLIKNILNTKLQHFSKSTR